MIEVGVEWAWNAGGEKGKEGRARGILVESSQIGGFEAGCEGHFIPIYEV